MLKKSIPTEATNVRDLTDEDVPSDRYFRNAWTDALPGTQIDVDMDKARVIHRTHIRRSRDKELARLDIEQLKVLTDPVKLQEIEAQKQILRDLPQTFDLTVVNSPVALKVLWPSQIPDDRNL